MPTSTSNDLTTLICLFHHKDQAQAALEDILKAGVPETSVTTLGGDGSTTQATRESLIAHSVPARDADRLLTGITDGGTVLVVKAVADHEDAVESIFAEHKAAKIDELETEDEVLPLAATATTGETVIPITAEELQVGKRTVDTGGVRVFKRVVEVPVEQNVTLREEHVNVERHAVDRPVTDADLRMQGDRTIELTETAEEAVVGKTARVVEEVLVGKQVTERTEHITDTVRHTEVEVENVAPTTTPKQNY